MSRIKVSIPEQLLFETSYPVTIDLINYGGHVGNDRFLLVMQEARMRWLATKGVQSEISLPENKALFVTDVAGQFLAEVFHGAQLTVKLFLGGQSRCGFDVVAQMFNEQQEVFRGKTGMVCVDLNTRRASSLPKDLALFMI